MAWLNRFRFKADQSVVHEFTCACPPMSGAHERMVNGVLINMGDDYYLEDGVPMDDQACACTT
jgi:hypothetical protein